MNYSCNSVARRKTHGVVKREKSITGQHSPCGLIPSRIKREASRTNPVHLTRPYTQALPLGGDHDGVGTHVTHQSPSKLQILLFLG